jgi:hypothetical protein
MFFVSALKIRHFTHDSVSLKVDLGCIWYLDDMLPIVMLSIAILPAQLDMYCSSMTAP